MDENRIKLILLLGLYTFTSLTALYLLKRGMAEVETTSLLTIVRSGFTLPVIAGAFLYGTSFLLWMAMLRSYQLSSIYAIVAGSTILLTSLLGMFFFSETVTVAKVAGTVLIIAGILLLGQQI